MNHRANAAAVVVATVLVTAVALGIGASASAATVVNTYAGIGALTGAAISDALLLQSPLADLIDFLQQLDALMETVLDLLRTISRLFGAGEAGG